MPNILVTGGAGYVGAVLVPKLLQRGWPTRVLDLMIYGEQVLDSVRASPLLEVIRGDLRDPKAVEASLKGIDTVIHLACISNDPSFDLDPALGKSINFDSFRPLVEASRTAGVRRFIFASSSSVYGVKPVTQQVHEDTSLDAITDYARSKVEGERILREYDSENFVTVSIRPATVCGYSPRQRLDIITNLMTNHAINRGVIKVFGGTQKRPSIYIGDMADLYVRLVEEPANRIRNKVWNAGWENFTADEIAATVQAELGGQVQIVHEPTDDPRSYHISSTRLTEELGFKPKGSTRDAVRELKAAFASGKLPNALTDPRYFNIKMMQSLSLK